ncbi:Phophatidylserine decarboxylase-domain-containing protein [Penicillium lividum]|nr:Phophatidylserine decarboxylase-domain-containing protein [Penicillium lividum]
MNVLATFQVYLDQDSSRNLFAGRSWAWDIVEETDKRPRTLHPVLQDFQQLIETNSRVDMLFRSLFQQKTCTSKIRDYQHMLHVLNHVITHCPPWSAKGRQVGLPLGAIFFDYAQTAVGFATFLDPDVNSMIKNVLNAWANFLQSKDSAAVLDDSASGWFSSPALAALTSAVNIGGTTYTFDEMFVCDPTAPYHGFQSWDAFFTRTFREDIRTVAFPDDDSIIVNACESQPTALAKDLKAQDSFWIKGQSYSLSDMIGQDYSDHFIGGTVYQGFLSAFSYHRWHAPVSGKLSRHILSTGHTFRRH